MAAAYPCEDRGQVFVRASAIDESSAFFRVRAASVAFSLGILLLKNSDRFFRLEFINYQRNKCIESGFMYFIFFYLLVNRVYNSIDP